MPEIEKRGTRGFERLRLCDKVIGARAGVRQLRPDRDSRGNNVVDRFRTRFDLDHIRASIPEECPRGRQRIRGCRDIATDDSMAHAAANSLARKQHLLHRYVALRSEAPDVDADRIANRHHVHAGTIDDLRHLIVVDNHRHDLLSFALHLLKPRDSDLLTHLKQYYPSMRLNNVIRALEAGQIPIVAFSPPTIESAIEFATTKYDGVVFEAEHNPYDIKALRDSLQYMLNRKQIVESASVMPAVTPIIRIPPNGGEMNQWLAKQVLDIGAYGVV